jgi:YidC/Oxa1 family membrane protein insertase
MNKNLFTAIALCLVIYIGWATWVEKNYGGKTAPKPRAENTLPQRTSIGNAAHQSTISPSTVKMSSPANAKVEMALIPFKTPHAAVLFNPRGAGISSYRFFGPVYESELVPDGDPGFFATMSDVDFAVKGQTADAITFAAEPSPGLSIEKTYTWPKDGLGRIEITVENKTKNSVELPEWGIHLGPGMDTVQSDRTDLQRQTKAMFAVNQEGRKNAVTKDLAKESYENGWLWAGVENRYFLAAIVPDQWQAGKIEFSKKDTEKVKDAPALSAMAEKSVLAPGEKKTWSVAFYMGPKDYRKLTAMGHSLDRAVDFGFFGIIGKLALKVLYFNYGLTKNYGWAIIMLTLCLQLLMIPLTAKSFKANMIMRKIQPKLQEIQKKHKDNPQRLNQEMMELYRTEGANPFGGCLPMLLQMPIFIALYNALKNSWDLHGSTFALWITDLSAKDPYFVLPVMLGLIMFFQQKIMMPQGGDPTQAMMMKIMPVMMTVFFISMPSGLGLYWLTNSILGFSLQLYLQKKWAQ